VIDGARLPAPRLILASASPRRRELLTLAGYTFEIHPADIDEDDHPPLTPSALAEFLAIRKAAVIAEHFPDDVILAADTVVAVGDLAIGKQPDELAATKTLGLLSNTKHQVITGICVQHGARRFLQHAIVTTTVVMKKLSPEEIATYVASNQWRGKAGGYGIQDPGTERFILATSGSHTNIMGLPMEKTTELLTAAGI
jgi:septum formation protein